MDKFHELVLKGVREAGICEEWYSELEEADMDEMLRMYVRGIDFVLRTGFPDNEFITEHCDMKTLNRHGVYVDDELVGAPGSGVYVLNGCCTGVWSWSDRETARVFVRGEGVMEFFCKGDCHVVVDVFDRGCVRVVQEDGARVLVQLHGDEAHGEGVADEGSRLSIRRRKNQYKNV